jgi:major membrane immunogen (membrane-anchored lipoprotein)
MKKEVFATACTLSLTLAMLTACSKGGGAPLTYADGVYTGQSGKDDAGAYGEVTIVIEDGAPVSCEFVTWQADGSIKDEEYGKVNGEITNKDFYDKAQLAVEAMEVYETQYVEVKDIEGVDAISGATISHGQFVEAVTKALSEAEASAEK